MRRPGFATANALAFLSGKFVNQLFSSLGDSSHLLSSSFSSLLERDEVGSLAPPSLYATDTRFSSEVANSAEVCLLSPSGKSTGNLGIEIKVEISLSIRAFIQPPQPPQQGLPGTFTAFLRSRSLEPCVMFIVGLTSCQPGRFGRLHLHFYLQASPDGIELNWWTALCRQQNSFSRR